MLEVINHTMVPLTSPVQWREALKGIAHAFGHTWENCYAMYLTTGYETYLYCYETDETKICCPIAEREFNGHIDVVTPYGFSGFIGNNGHSEVDQEWKSFAQSKGYVCGYIGLNPVLENIESVDSSDLYEYNTLYVLDLKQSIETLFQRLSLNRRRQLKDYSNIVQQYTTDKALLKSFFISQFYDFFIQKNASQVYSFTPETLAYIIDLENVLVVGAKENGKIVAVSVFAYTPYVADYLFNVSVEEGRSHAVPLIWFAVNYLQNLNIPFLNLGGGVKKGDSLSQFKERFGGTEYGLKCLKQVYDHYAYDQLCKETNSNTSKDAYFPPYRKP